MGRAQAFVASDEFIVWAQSLGGMLTRMETEYGGIAEMVEHPAWDEGRTTYALHLLQSLCKHIAQVERELHIHVEEKTGKKP